MYGSMHGWKCTHAHKQHKQPLTNRTRSQQAIATPTHRHHCYNTQAHFTSCKHIKSLI